MASEDAAGVAAIEDVAELRRLLAAAQQTAKVSLARANQHAGELSRWRGQRNELAIAVREALGMDPVRSKIHTSTILARIGEIRADRDLAVAEAGQLRRAATLRERTLADLTDEVEALRLTVAEREPEVNGLQERLSIAREAIDAERARTAVLEQGIRAARAEAAHNARRVRALETSKGSTVKASAEAEAQRIKAAQQRDRAAQAEAQVAELRAQAAELRARVAELEREARARPEPSPVRPAPIGVLSEVEQITAADRIARSPRVVSALRGADVAALLRSGAPVAVALGRVALGGVGEAMDRAGLVLALAQAWAKGVR